MYFQLSKKYNVTLFLSALALTLASTPSYANYSCTGPVQQVQVGPSGDVNATFLFANGNAQWIHVCNVSAQEGSVNPTSCKSILSVLLLAKANQQPVQVWFNNTTGGCNFNSWTNLSDYGWYWGPSIGS